MQISKPNSIMFVNSVVPSSYTLEPHYNEDIGTMKNTLLWGLKDKKNIKSMDHKNLRGLQLKWGSTA